MKITINLSDSEVKALKAYLKEVSHDVNPKITKEDIKTEIVGAVSCHLQAGCLGDYYKLYCLNTLPANFNRGLQMHDHSNISDNGYEDF